MKHFLFIGIIQSDNSTTVEHIKHSLSDNFEVWELLSYNVWLMPLVKAKLIIKMIQNKLKK